VVLNLRFKVELGVAANKRDRVARAMSRKRNSAVDLETLFRSRGGGRPNQHTPSSVSLMKSNTDKKHGQRGWEIERLLNMPAASSQMR
jgi:hypothetical protein